MKRILLVEDEAGLRMTLEDRLSAEGYAVQTASAGGEGYSLAAAGQFDIILLDIMLPEMDGFTVCTKLRDENITTPVIMLTAKSQLDDKLTGLAIGGDDYITKPFEMQELLARIEALLRRIDTTRKDACSGSESRESDISIDFRQGCIFVRGKKTMLLAQEIKLLGYFSEHPGEIIKRADLLSSVWGYDSNITTRTIDVHIARLRQKLGDVGDAPRYIQTIRGIGYKFCFDGVLIR
jgi:DNA-binding response OmpR family regulator